jgi:DTW domain-containing protein YfiP
MHRNVCLCALLPRLRTRTQLILIMHQLEVSKTTNTGRLAALCIEGTQVVVRGREGARGPVADAPPPLTLTFPPDTQPLLLFPHDDATALESWVASPRPVTLVVPDGTWSQAIRARKRIPGLAALPCARLPSSASLRADRFQLRHDGRPGHLSTLAAVAIALGILEGSAVQQELERILAMMIDRTLWTNGRIKSADVSGGIPEGARPHDPLGRQNQRGPL